MKLLQIGILLFQLCCLNFNEPILLRVTDYNAIGRLVYVNDRSVKSIQFKVL